MLTLDSIATCVDLRQLVGVSIYANASARAHSFTSMGSRARTSAPCSRSLTNLSACSTSSIGATFSRPTRSQTMCRRATSSSCSTTRFKHPTKYEHLKDHESADGPRRSASPAKVRPIAQRRRLNAHGAENWGTIDARAVVSEAHRLADC
jgi:hypothetical protein